MLINVCTTSAVLESVGSPKLVAEDSTDGSVVGTDGSTEICVEVLISVFTDECMDDVAGNDGGPEIWVPESNSPVNEATGDVVGTDDKTTI